MRLRLALHGPYQFIPVPVYIHRFSHRRLWSLSVRAGDYESALPRVIEKALARLPNVATLIDLCVSNGTV